jgi:hypothetical protein
MGSESGLRQSSFHRDYHSIGAGWACLHLWEREEYEGLKGKLAGLGFVVQQLSKSASTSSLLSEGEWSQGCSLFQNLYMLVSAAWESTNAWLQRFGRRGLKEA